MKLIICSCMGRWGLHPNKIISLKILKMIWWNSLSTQWTIGILMTWLNKKTIWTCHSLFFNPRHFYYICNSYSITDNSICVQHCKLSLSYIILHMLKLLRKTSNKLPILVNFSCVKFISVGSSMQSVLSLINRFSIFSFVAQLLDWRATILNQ